MQLRSFRGDTLVEVIVSIAVFSLVTVGLFSIMQRGTAGATGAMERSQVRMIMNTQAEYLAYLRDQYNTARMNSTSIAVDSPAGQWVRIRDNVSATPAPATNSCTTTAPASSFYIKRTSGVFDIVTGTPTMPTGMPNAGDGMWIQKVDPEGYASGALKQRYHDFYILSCWNVVGTTTQYLSTIVRLYEPIN